VTAIVASRKSLALTRRIAMSKAEGRKLVAESYKLWDEGDKLVAKGHKLLREGDKLWDESNKLETEGDKLVAEGKSDLANEVMKPTRFKAYGLTYLPNGGDTITYLGEADSVELAIEVADYAAAHPSCYNKLLVEETKEVWSVVTEEKSDKLVAAGRKLLDESNKLLDESYKLLAESYKLLAGDKLLRR